MSFCDLTALFLLPNKVHHMSVQLVYPFTYWICFIFCVSLTESIQNSPTGLSIIYCSSLVWLIHQIVSGSFPSYLGCALTFLSWIFCLSDLKSFSFFLCFNGVHPLLTASENICFFLKIWHACKSVLFSQIRVFKT